MVETIAPFYEAGIPPPPFPLLTIQTDLANVSFPAATITATEELPSRLVTRIPVRLPSSGPIRTQRTLPRFPSPYVIAPPKKVMFASDTRSDSSELSECHDDDDDDDDGDDGDDNTSSTSSSHGLIPKPQGQAGRPNRGGYNLEVALNWPPKTFSKLQNYVHRLIDTHLDISQSYQPQKETARQLVQNEASNAFPQLLEYEGCWPINDVMMLHLKNTSRHEKLKAQKLAAGHHEARMKGKGKAKENSANL